MVVILNLLLLLISVGGVLVSLPITKHRRKLICIFIAAGAAAGALTLITSTEREFWSTLTVLVIWVWRASRAAVSATYASSLFWPGACVICIAGGMALQKWAMPAIVRSFATGALPFLPAAASYADRWATPREAVSLFVDPALLRKAHMASDEAKNMRTNFDNLPVVDGVIDPAEAQRRQAALERCEAMEELAARRNSDVMGNLYGQFKGPASRLIAKGNKQYKNGDLQAHETILPSHMWGIVWSNKEILDLDTNILAGYLGVYHNVMIGERRP